MDSFDDNNSSDHCEHSHVDGKVLTTAIAAVGVIIGVVLLIVVLTCVKAYKSYLQRIYIFIVFSMIFEDTLRLLGSLFNNSAVNDHKLSQVCEFLGFLTLVFHWSTYITCLVWQSYLLTIVCIQVVHEPALVTKVKASKKLRTTIEVLIILLVYFGPALTVLGIPLYIHELEYGFTGYICALKPVLNSSKTVEVFAQMYSYTPIAFSVLTAVCTLLGFMIVYCTISERMKSAKKAVKNLSVLSLSIIGFLVVYLIISFVLKALICDNVVLYGINTSFTTVGKFTIFIPYLIVFDCSRKKPSLNDTKVHVNKEYGSFKESSRESPPSDTRFTVPYTDGFTDIPRPSSNGPNSTHF